MGRSSWGRWPSAAVAGWAVVRRTAAWPAAAAELPSLEVVATRLRSAADGSVLALTVEVACQDETPAR